MKKIQYNCFIDSIQIRYNNLKLQQLYFDRYNYKLTSNGTYIFQTVLNEKIYNLFELKTRKDFNKIEYQLLSFNGFKKYNDRDDLIKDVFYEIIQLLVDNGITFFLNKIDLSIDFYDVDIDDLKYIQKRKKQGVRRVLLSELDEELLDDIRTNKITFNLEPQTKNKKRYQHSKIYHKSIKEQKKGNLFIDDNIYRFEVVLSNFSNVEKINITDYKVNLLNEIKHRFNKYQVQVNDEEINFDFSLVEDVINHTVRL